MQNQAQGYRKYQKVKTKLFGKGVRQMLENEDLGFPVRKTNFAGVFSVIFEVTSRAYSGPNGLF